MELQALLTRSMWATVSETGCRDQRSAGRPGGLSASSQKDMLSFCASSACF